MANSAIAPKEELKLTTSIYLDMTLSNLMYSLCISMSISSSAGPNRSDYLMEGSNELIPILSIDVTSVPVDVSISYYLEMI